MEIVFRAFSETLDFTFLKTPTMKTNIFGGQMVSKSELFRGDFLGSVLRGLWAEILCDFDDLWAPLGRPWATSWSSVAELGGKGGPESGQGGYWVGVCGGGTFRRCNSLVPTPSRTLPHGRRSIWKAYTGRIPMEDRLSHAGYPATQGRRI